MFKEKVTHGIVRTLSKEDSAKTGIYAYINLYFGPAETSGIVGITFRRTGPNQYSYVAPRSAMLDRDGKRTEFSVFEGELWLTDLSVICSHYIDTIKRSLGSLKYSKEYRVTLSTAEEISHAEANAR